MSFRLIVRLDGRSEAHSFDQAEVSIGRGRDNDLLLPDRLVSRRHCRVVRDDDGAFSLIDEGGQNPVRLHGQAVATAVIRFGDIFAVGNCEVELAPPMPRAPSSLDETFIEDDARSAQDLTAFIAIAKALNEEQELSRLLTLIVDSAIQLTGAERGFLLLGASEDSTVEIARNFAQEEIHSPEFKISRTIAQRVRRDGVPELTTNAQEDARFAGSQSIADLRLRSILCIPIRVRSAIEGVLYVDNRLQQQVFQEREKQLLVSLADHAGIAIHNARSMQSLREQQLELQAAVERVAQLNSALKGQIAAQKDELSGLREVLSDGETGRYRYDYRSIVGDSRRMRDLYALLDKYVPADDPVLILGESGTGKELVARAIHSQGPRQDGQFVSENVAALPESLLESELFGHVKGAFTGATANKQGLLESAHGGVLFLDEIGEMPLELQAKLLRVLQEGEVRPLGARDTVQVEFRLITATNRSLEEMVQEGDFRADLYYRLNVLPIRLPPLRERREDVPGLVQRFLLELPRAPAAGRVRVSPDAMAALSEYSWPGNVRELQNEIRRAALMGDGVILREHLSERVRDPQPAPDVGPLGPTPAEAGTTLPDMVQALETREIERAFAQANGNKSRAAELLGLSRFALQRKLEKFGIGTAQGADGDGESES